ncbi:aKG-HExxH-type peptide beta-hydroxylase [Streptomyces sp. SAS_270]|uniref:aKG-HExxH-type peptide beta-hydroxylase n=1 Tax=Streptomyces sp. SAS_270 TaxID=3412748 RepID=UPI00403C1F05
MPVTGPNASWALLGAVHRTQPAAVEGVLSDPAVGAWTFPLLRHLLGATTVTSDAPQGDRAALLGALAAATAVRARMRCSLRIPAHRGRLWLPSLGLVGTVARGEWPVVSLECGPSGALVFGDTGSVRLPDDLSRPADGWSPLWRIDTPEPGVGGPVGAALDHLSPYRDFRSRRDPDPLPAAALRDWQELVRATYELLHQEHPVVHRMVTGSVRSLVPVEGPSLLRPVSASAPDAQGCVTVSRASDAPAFAATLIHEARHQLLTALADLVPLIVSPQDGPQATYFAPWREDPRPLRGLLYGAHAFAGVTSFWRERRRVEPGDRADFEFAFHRWQLQAALATLRNATGLTVAGGHVVSALAQSAREWWVDPVSGPSFRLAALCQRDVWATWRAANLAVDRVAADDLGLRWATGRPPPSPLPAARVAPGRRASPPGDARIWLARLWCTDRDAFDQVRADLERGCAHPLGIAGATPADAALVGGDAGDALEGYRDQYRDDPARSHAWIGAGLAVERSSMLVERPELVLALHEALLRRGVASPGPEDLAEWLVR